MSRVLSKFKKKMVENFKEKIDSAYKTSNVGQKRTRYNLFTKSQMFSDAVWVNGQLTLGAGEIAGDGTSSAFSLIPTSTSATHSISRTMSSMVNSEYVTFFVDFKTSTTSSKFRVSIWNSVTTDGINFTIDTSTTTPSISRTDTSTYTAYAEARKGLVQEYSIRSIGGGYYRVTIVAQSPDLQAGTNGIGQRKFGVFCLDSSGASTFAGNGTTVYATIWRAQLEYSTKESDYQLVDTEFNYSKVEEVEIDEGDRFFVFVGNPNPSASASPEYEADFYSTVDPWRNMMFGKRVGQDDTRFMTRKVEWASGARFSAYDHKDPLLENKQFYALVDKTRVYKCISNSGGGASTVKPTSTVVGKPFRLADGYVWLYMYSLNSSEYTRFQTETFMPVIQNQEVKDAAVDGAVMAIRVVNGGSGYPFMRGAISAYQPNSADVFIDIDSDVRVEGNKYTDQNYFTQCALVIEDSTTGFKEAVTISTSDYVTSGGVKRLRLRLAEAISQFEPTSGSRISIAPTIWVRGYNRKEMMIDKITLLPTTTTSCRGYAIINETNGAVADVVILQEGSGYREGYVEVLTTKQEIIPAELDVVIGPPGGHGFDTMSELFAKNLGISIKLNGASFPTDVSYAQVGLLSNPYRTSGSVFGKDDPNTATIEGELDADEYSQILEIGIAAIDGASALFAPGDEVVTDGSERRGYVAYATSSVVGLVGIEGQDSTSSTDDFFTPEEILSSVTGNKKWRIQADPIDRAIPKVNRKPDLAMFSGEIHYLQNINSIQRPVDVLTSPETVKIILKF